MRYSGRLLPFALFALSTCVLAQSSSFSSHPQGDKNIKITGTATYGYAAYSDFTILGSGLTLRQGSWDGPSYIGHCTIGVECTLTFGLPLIAVCPYCSYNSMGLWGSVTAGTLEQNLTFKATGVYDGSGEMTMHLNFSGTVTGYQLLDVPGTQDCYGGAGYNCMLGPALFSFRITGHGTGEVQNAIPVSPTEVWIGGLSMSFSGVAHLEDLP